MHFRPIPPFLLSATFLQSLLQQYTKATSDTKLSLFIWMAFEKNAILHYRLLFNERSELLKNIF